MFAKGRSHAKLTPAQVEEIRVRTGEVQETIAQEYGVHQTTISRIQRGDGWRMVGEPIRRDLRARLTEDDVRRAWYWAATGDTGAEIARRLGVSQPTISKILNGKSWRAIS